MPFKKGESGNPNGRPPMGKSWADVLRRIGEEKVSGQDVTKKEAICRRLYAEAAKGEQWAINALMDRIDGKPTQKVESKNDNIITIEHEIAD